MDYVQKLILSFWTIASFIFIKDTHLVDGMEIIDEPKRDIRKKSLVGPLCRDDPAARCEYSLSPQECSLESL